MNETQNDHILFTHKIVRVCCCCWKCGLLQINTTKCMLQNGWLRIEQMCIKRRVFSLCVSLFQQCGPELISGGRVAEDKFSFFCRQQVVDNNIYPSTITPELEVKYSGVTYFGTTPFLLLHVHNDLQLNHLQTISENHACSEAYIYLSLKVRVPKLTKQWCSCTHLMPEFGLFSQCRTGADKPWVSQLPFTQVVACYSFHN